MKCLTKDEITHWLRKHGQIEEPHLQKPKMPSLFHAQFYPPKKFKGIENFTRNFLDEIVAEGDLLVQFAYWELFDGSTEFTLDSWWKSAAETRQLEEVPGCVMSFKDRDQAIALFSITTCFRWQTYIYSSHHQTILFNWEGDVYDAWTTSARKMKGIQKLIKLFKLKLA